MKKLLSTFLFFTTLQAPKLPPLIMRPRIIYEYSDNGNNILIRFFPENMKESPKKKRRKNKSQELRMEKNLERIRLLEKIRLKRARKLKHPQDSYTPPQGCAGRPKTTNAKLLKREANWKR